jgi:dihydroflavonol-4-reductase
VGEAYLVTGACGFSGSHLVDELVARGDRLIAMDVQGTDTSYVDRASVPFMPADLTRPDTLEGVFARGPFTGVYHFAELSSHGAALGHLRHVNVDGTKNLLDAMRRHDVPRLVALSTGGVYGHPEEVPVYETVPHSPLTRYDASKSEMEAAIQEAGEEWGLQWTVLRPAAMYGPRSRKGAAVPLFLMALGQLPAVPGRGTNYAAFTHVLDVAGAARFLMHHPFAVAEAYNVADDTILTVQDVLFLLAPHVDAHINKVHLPLWGLRLLSWWNRRRAARTGRPSRIEEDAFVHLVHDTFMSNRKLKDAGYEMRYPDFIQGMVETIAWYKANNWLWRDPSLRRELDTPGLPP